MTRRGMVCAAAAIVIAGGAGCAGPPSAATGNVLGPTAPASAANTPAGPEMPWWQQRVVDPVVPPTPITLSGDVLFDPDSAVLTTAAGSQLQSVLDILGAHPRARATIEGHTDGGDGGPHETALALSRARADSVRAWLTERGVAADRIDVQGWGSTKPLLPSDTPEHRAANRRCDITVTEPPS